MYSAIISKNVTVHQFSLLVYIEASVEEVSRYSYILLTTLLCNLGCC